MDNWLSAINSLAATAAPAVLVTVAAVEGSAPREASAKMLVAAHAQYDTIGGGHIEMRACDIAREMLASGERRRIGRFALGPSLGQCCGGVVHLAFETIDCESRTCYARLAELWRDRQESWRMVSLDTALPTALVDADGRCLAGSLPPALAGFDREGPCRLLRDEQGRSWLIDPCRPWRPHLVLFGAGHVGAAIVRALADLPCHVTWVDEREDLFPVSLPANVKIEATDTPEAVVDEVPPGSTYLVLTHSHALDQRLSEAILRRADAGWFGLIGSKTKRMQFEHRLRERGIVQERLADMVCPIGVPGITGKAPAVIAAAVCAQLLQVWEAEEKARSYCAAMAH
jgi:xanthine dehydrogenase accessory factor